MALVASNERGCFERRRGHHKRAATRWDAAIAVASSLAVRIPAAGNLGGGGFMISSKGRMDDRD